MTSYIKVLLVDRVGNGSPVVWYSHNDKPISARLETESDALTFAKSIARILGIDKIYVEGQTDNYLLSMNWTVCPGLRAPDELLRPSQPLDVIAKAAV